MSVLFSAPCHLAATRRYSKVRGSFSRKVPERHSATKEASWRDGDQRTHQQRRHRQSKPISWHRNFAVRAPETLNSLSRQNLHWVESPTWRERAFWNYFPPCLSHPRKCESDSFGAVASPIT